MKTILSTVALLLSTLAASCAPPASEPDPLAGPAIYDEQVPAELQDQLTAYVNALVDRDLGALQATVSSQVLAHARAHGLTAAAFLEQQRAALVHGRCAGERPVLAIGEITRRGAGLRASVYLEEQELPRALIFVKERGAFRLSAGPPDSPAGRCDQADELILDLLEAPRPQPTASLRKVR